MKIVFLRSLPLERDSRSTKMVVEYRRRGHSVTPVIWSRGDATSESDETVTCRTAGAYGKRLGNIFARLKWMYFLARYLIVKRNSYGTIHAVDLDTAILAVPLGKILKKSIIYDAFDSIGAILGENFISKILVHIEKKFIENSNLSIFPDTNRTIQYLIKNLSNIEIIGNIPESIKLEDYCLNNSGDNSKITIVYIGTLEANYRGLEYIPEICRKFPEKIEFIVGGTGQLHSDFLAWSHEVENLDYVGHVAYSEALRLMAKADALYGPYLLSAPAHKYASPNKMYEHLMLGKAFITNAGTPPANLAQTAASGLIFDGTLSHLTALIAAVSHDQCITAGQNALHKWETEYSTLREEQLNRFFSRFDKL